MQSTFCLIQITNTSDHHSGTKAMTQAQTYHMLAVRTARRAVALQ
jgi:hypothetical protein